MERGGLLKRDLSNRSLCNEQANKRRRNVSFGAMETVCFNKHRNASDLSLGVTVSMPTFASQESQPNFRWGEQSHQSPSGNASWRSSPAKASRWNTPQPVTPVDPSQNMFFQRMAKSANNTSTALNASRAAGLANANLPARTLSPTKTTQGLVSPDNSFHDVGHALRRSSSFTAPRLPARCPSPTNLQPCPQL